MCYTIQSENLLANYFSIKNKKRISYSHLDGIKLRIEKTFGENVYVDTSFDSLVAAVNYNNGIFKLFESQVGLEKNGQDLIKNKDYIENNFNWCLPESVKEKYLSIISDVD